MRLQNTLLALKIQTMFTPSDLPHALKALLAGVSRSFGLSLRLLPRRVRPVISLAYLLARTSDTLADAAHVPVAHRRHALETWLKLLDAATTRERSLALQSLQLLLPPYREAQLPASELTLLEHFGLCLDALAHMPTTDQQSIARVMGPIGQGQLEDLERSQRTLATVQTERELDRYTWQVAGCVGDFWTDCLYTHLPHTLGMSVAQMKALGQHYGQGLQRLNILLDAAQDLRNGRCYVPTETLQRLFLTPVQLQSASVCNDHQTLTRLEPMQTLWFDQVEDALREGIRYCCALRSWRLRLASALPALVGAASLHLLRQHPTASLMQRLKWQRAELQKHLLLLLIQGVSPRALQRQFEHLLHSHRSLRNATIKP